MTERERFEEWWISQNYSGPYDKLMWGKELQLIAWQAALKGRGEPVAWMHFENGAVISKRKKEQNGIGNAYPLFDIPLYTAPPNTYTEADVDAMLMKVAEQIRYGVKFDDIRTIIDKVKAG